MLPITQNVINSLNLRSKDYFVSYGMGPGAREIVNQLKTVSEVSAGIALDDTEFEESGKIKTAIYRGTKSFEGKRAFDKVYCDYQALPKNYRDFNKALNTSYNLCSDKGMVMVTGVTNNALAHSFLSQKHITKYWLLRQNAYGFDLLYVKEKHFDR